MFSDLELFQKVSSYDSRALETLYDRYSPVLYTLIRKIVVKETVAEEILTDIFAIIWRKIEYFDFSNGNVYSWLIMLARNKAVDYVRRNRAANTVAAEPYDENYENNFIIPHLSGGEQFSLEKAFENRDNVEKALGRLTDAQKYVIHLAFYEGYTQKAIAEKLNIPIQTVKSKLQIAMGNLADNLNMQAGI